MARRAHGGISYVEGKGYRLTVGKAKGDDGVERYKTWWLGHDRGFAKYAARDLRDGWEYLQRHGQEYWEPFHLTNLLGRLRSCFDGHSAMLVKKIAETEAEAQEIRHRLAVYRNFEEQPTAALTPALPPMPVIPTLHAALDAYVAAMKTKALSSSYKTRIAETIRDLKHYRPDCALTAIDRIWLERLTDEIKARPKSRKKDRRTKKRESIKPATVKTYLQHWRQAFDWIDRAADGERFGRWQWPRRGDELFRVDVNKIMTKPERDKAADGPNQLTVDEIRKLVHAATDRQRMLILLGLFAGMGQTELRWCRRDEFDLDAGRFVHRRNKTRQRGQWFLPPELVKLLRDYFKEVKPLEDGSAFRTREGQPLVTETSDSVRQMFEDVRASANIERPGVTFYALRRFLGDRAKRRGGVELRDATLAHAGHSVGDRHYSNYRDFEQVEELGRQLYRGLKSSGVFDWPTEDAPQSNRSLVTN